MSHSFGKFILASKWLQHPDFGPTADWIFFRLTVPGDLGSRVLTRGPSPDISEVTSIDEIISLIIITIRNVSCVW